MSYRMEILVLIIYAFCLQISHGLQESGICSASEEWPCMDKISSSKLLIKGGTVVNADRKQLADVYIEDGTIVAVQPNIKVADEVCILDASGKYVMPV